MVEVAIMAPPLPKLTHGVHIPDTRMPCVTGIAPRGYDPADNLLGACYSLRFKWPVVSWSYLLSTGAQSKGIYLSAACP